MKLFYDVETTGLPDFKKPANDKCQPHIIQVACILTDENCVEKSRMNEFVKPDGWVLTPEISKLTGITQEQLIDSGKPIYDVVNSFINLWRESKMTVAHNDSFDRGLFRIEMARLFGKHTMLDEWKFFPAFCTMKESTDIIKLPPTQRMIDCGFNKFKSPKLEEAYYFYFGRKPEISHDALADVESTVEIYKKMMGKA